MKIVAIMPVRNEAWCLRHTLPAVLRWADAVVIVAHCCTDESTEIIRKARLDHLDQQVMCAEESNPIWHEMQQRQHMLQWSRILGATHVAIVDADEVLTENLVPGIRDIIEATPPGHMLQLPWVCLRGDLHHFHADGVWGNAMVSFCFPDQPDFRWSSQERDGYDFHRRHPLGCELFHRPIGRGEGGLIHLQFVRDRALRAKQAHYQMTEVRRWPGRQTPAQLAAMYGLAVHQRGRILPVRPGWWPQEVAGIDLTDDGSTWHEAEIRQWIKEDGRERYAGLDLFGIA